MTFNYDTMLEDALPAVGLQIAQLSDYIEGAYKLVKLHGSVHWARVVTPVEPWDVDLTRPAMEIAHTLINKIPNLMISQQYRMVKRYPLRDDANRQALFPAIAVPMQTKHDYECPPEHLSVLTENIPHLTKLLVIGWRAKESHFLRLLKEKLSRLLKMLVISGSDQGGRAVLDTLSSEGIGDGTFAGNGFTDFILQRTGEQFLRG